MRSKRGVAKHHVLLVEYLIRKSKFILLKGIKVGATPRRVYYAVNRETCAKSLRGKRGLRGKRIHGLSREGPRV